VPQGILVKWPNGKPGMPCATWYSRLAKGAPRFCGRPRVLVFALGIIAVSAIAGPVFRFSDT